MATKKTMYYGCDCEGCTNYHRKWGDDYDYDHICKVKGTLEHAYQEECEHYEEVPLKRNCRTCQHVLAIRFDYCGNEKTTVKHIGDGKHAKTCFEYLAVKIPPEKRNDLQYRVKGD